MNAHPMPMNPVELVINKELFWRQLTASRWAVEIVVHLHGGREVRHGYDMMDFCARSLARRWSPVFAGLQFLKLASEQL